ncbi:MAG: HD-GYP domain-containing protein [Gammaproteobacteria bacterium]
MSQKHLRVDTADLKFGMYVAELDRPWLGTPFLFQGFTIEDDDELQQLKDCCDHVFVDATRSLLAEEKQRRISDAARPAKAENLKPVPQSTMLDVISSLDSSGTLAGRIQARPYHNTVSTHAEASRATMAYDAAASVMADILGKLQSGKGLDTETLRVAMSPMIDSVTRNQDAMAWLVQLRKRDTYAYNHSLASSVWAVILGRHLGFDRAGLDTLAMDGLLLDMGKAEIAAEILVKPTPLDERERKIMRTHVERGARMAADAPGMTADIMAMIDGHHERHDGSGYPQGLAGAEIPVFGRIAGLVDTFDAMITARPYARAKSSYDAIRELNSLAGTAFQRELVEQFVQALGMFPTGSLVQLNTGEVGIVIEQNRVRRLRPKLMLLLQADKSPVNAHSTVDLRTVPASGSGPSARWIVCGLEPGAHGLDPRDFFA